MAIGVGRPVPAAVAVGSFGGAATLEACCCCADCAVWSFSGGYRKRSLLPKSPDTTRHTPTSITIMTK